MLNSLLTPFGEGFLFNDVELAVGIVFVVLVVYDAVPIVVVGTKGSISLGFWFVGALIKGIEAIGQSSSSAPSGTQWIIPSHLNPMGIL